MMQMDDGDVSTRYDYNGLNQLEKATCVDMDSNEEVSVTEYTYDDRGNLIEEIETDSASGTESARVYEYSVMGELLLVSDGGSVIQSNCYDESGSRISKTEGGSTKQYYYSGGRLIYIDGGTDTSGVIDPSGNMISAYFGTEYGIYCEDVQGSTYIILDSEFDTACRYSYMDFGETEEVTAEFDNEICYTGAIYDGTTGLYYMNARYYDPEAGRFLIQDTYRGEMDDIAQWHLYVYCADNPINYEDPSGHSVWSKTLKLREYREIHNKVADLVASQMRTYKACREKYVISNTGKRGFLDVYLKSKCSYYEIKSIGVAYSDNTKKQMERYDNSHLKNSKKEIGRAKYDVSGAFYCGAWKITYSKVKDGLIAYCKEFNQRRYSNFHAGIRVAAVVILGAACVATGGAASPGYAFFFI